MEKSENEIKKFKDLIIDYEHKEESFLNDKRKSDHNLHKLQLKLQEAEQRYEMEIELLIKKHERIMEEGLSKRNAESFQQEIQQLTIAHQYCGQKAAEQMEKISQLIQIRKTNEGKIHELEKNNKKLQKELENLNKNNEKLSKDLANNTEKRIAIMKERGKKICYHHSML